MNEPDSSPLLEQQAATLDQLSEIQATIVYQQQQLAARLEYLETLNKDQQEQPATALLHIVQQMNLVTAHLHWIASRR